MIKRVHGTRGRWERRGVKVWGGSLSEDGPEGLRLGEAWYGEGIPSGSLIRSSRL